MYYKTTPCAGLFDACTGIFLTLDAAKLIETERSNVSCGVLEPRKTRRAG